MIKERCPALFRPGRMTPIYFGHPTRTIIEDMTRYYFDREIYIPLPEILKTPTSNLIEICMESQTHSDPFSYYINEMTKLVKELT